MNKPARSLLLDTDACKAQLKRDLKHPVGFCAINPDIGSKPKSVSARGRFTGFDGMLRATITGCDWHGFAVAGSQGLKFVQQLGLDAFSLTMRAPEFCRFEVRIFDPINHLVTPLYFSKVRNPPSPNRPPKTVIRLAMSNPGNSGAGSPT